MGTSKDAVVAALAPGPPWVGPTGGSARPVVGLLLSVAVCGHVGGDRVDRSAVSRIRDTARTGTRARPGGRTSWFGVGAGAATGWPLGSRRQFVAPRRRRGRAAVIDEPVTERGSPKTQTKQHGPKRNTQPQNDNENKVENETMTITMKPTRSTTKPRDTRKETPPNWFGTIATLRGCTGQGTGLEAESLVCYQGCVPVAAVHEGGGRRRRSVSRRPSARG